MQGMNAARALCAAIFTVGVVFAAGPAVSQDKLKAAPKSQPAIGGFKATPRGTAKVTCGPKTCTCKGDDDCDALFTSTKCKAGTATHDTRTSNGECTAAN